MSKSIGEIKKEFEQADRQTLLSLYEAYADDNRAGVVSLISKYKKQEEKLEEEKKRIENMSIYERKYADFQYICGIDEVGRGPLAGPVVAGAVILPKDCDILYLNDSKKLSEKMREALYDEIMEKAVATGIGIVGPNVIDEINILQATFKAMRDAVAGLKEKPDYVLIDGDKSPSVDIAHEPVIKGDSKSMSIAAASILAKVSRDRYIVKMSEKYPGYGFEKHKGYGTKAHYEAISELGISPIHRKSFLKKILG